MKVRPQVLVLIVFYAFLGFVQSANADEQQLSLLIEYLAVDYAAAVDAGVVINDTEYGEMVEFSGQISTMVADLDENSAKETLLEESRMLGRAVQDKQDPDEIKAISLRLLTALNDGYDVLKVPVQAIDFNRAATLYQDQCAACHGREGHGDGQLAVSLDPSPTNFHDIDRYSQRTLSGLFNTISLGVGGTSMVNFGMLTEQERWSLAFYVGRFAAPAVKERPSWFIDNIKTMVTLTPASAVESWGEVAANEVSWLRQHPAELYEAKPSPLIFARQKLGEALTIYQSGDVNGAYKLSLVAYLEGFELVEPAMKAVDPEFAMEIESAMAALRASLQSGTAEGDIEEDIVNAQRMLLNAEQLLDESQLSPIAAFTSALIILLREGIEALLLVVALITFLSRTDRKESVKYIHLGWVGALAAGAVTWWISNTLVHISGSSREVTEGVAALIASAILLYVGFWMQSKSSGKNWQRFIEQEALKALSKGTLWGLTGLAFIAVYREVFETILFYQALWSQTAGLGQDSVFYGFLAGVILLIAFSFSLSLYSARLPIRQLFMVSGILMFSLSFILAGKGVGALQEAGWISSHPVTFVSIDVLGIYPYAESLAVQLFVLLVGLGYWFYSVRNSS